MQKIRLDLDTLVVESFGTTDSAGVRGTVPAHGLNSEVPRCENTAAGCPVGTDYNCGTALSDCGTCVSDGATQCGTCRATECGTCNGATCVATYCGSCYGPADSCDPYVC